MLHAPFPFLQLLASELGQIEFASEQDQELTQLEFGHPSFEVALDQGVHFIFVHEVHDWQPLALVHRTSLAAQATQILQQPCTPVAPIPHTGA